MVVLVVWHINESVYQLALHEWQRIRLQILAPNNHIFSMIDHVHPSTDLLQFRTLEFVELYLKTDVNSVTFIGIVPISSNLLSMLNFSSVPRCPRELAFSKDKIVLKQSATRLA
jgi:hypothetical protein